MLYPFNDKEKTGLDKKLGMLRNTPDTWGSSRIIDPCRLGRTFISSSQPCLNGSEHGLQTKLCKAGFGYSNCHVEVAWRGGVLHFLLCQRQLALHAQAPLRPVETGVVWCVLCRTREGHIALFALHTGLYPARIYFFYTGLVISKYALLLPMINAHFISASWKTGTASSSILYSSSRSSPCFIAAWGNPAVCLLGIQAAEPREDMGKHALLTPYTGADGSAKAFIPFSK